MLALMMRQAVRDGAKVTVIDPRPVDLPCEFAHIPTLPKNIAGSLSGEVLSGLEGATKPTIVVGTHICDEDMIKMAAKTVAGLVGKGLDAGIMYVMEGPNSFGNAILCPETDMDAVIEGIERGRIKALVALEADIIGRYPDTGRARKAIDKLDSLIVLDHVPSETVSAANVFIPTPATAEDDGVYVNNEGRAQSSAKAYTAGIPVNRTGPDNHPPREFNGEIPGGCAPAWKALNSIVCHLKPTCPVFGTVEGMRREAASLIPELDPIINVIAGSDGVLVEVPEEVGGDMEPRPEEYVGSGLLFISSEHVFGTEELSSYADVTIDRAPEGSLLMNPADAGKLKLADGDVCSVDAVSVSDEYDVKINPGVASGAVVGYSLHGTNARVFNGRVVRLMRKPEGA
jgi:NADH-quinone oxidoreductase subunit G